MTLRQKIAACIRGASTPEHAANLIVSLLEDQALELSGNGFLDDDPGASEALSRKTELEMIRIVREAGK